MTTIMQYLIACNIFNNVARSIKAYWPKTVSHKKMKHGALAKVTIWCVVVVSIILSGYLGTDLTTYIVSYYLLMEIISILENASVFVPVPEKIKNILSSEQIEKTTKETPNNVDPEILERIKEKNNE